MHFFTLLVFPGDFLTGIIVEYPFKTEWFRDVLLWLRSYVLISFVIGTYVCTRVDGQVQTSAAQVWGFVLLGFRSESQRPYHRSLSTENVCTLLYRTGLAGKLPTNIHKLGSILVNDTKKNLLPGCPLYPDPCNGLS